MTYFGIAQIAAFTALIALLTKPLGYYMARVFAGERTMLRPVLRTVEKALYRVAGVDPAKEQSWLDYALSFLAFNLFGILALYAVQRLQLVLPVNPLNMAGVSPESLFEHGHQFHQAVLRGGRHCRIRAEPVMLPCIRQAARRSRRIES